MYMPLRLWDHPEPVKWRDVWELLDMAARLIKGKTDTEKWDGLFLLRQAEVLCPTEAHESFSSTMQRVLCPPEPKPEPKLVPREPTEVEMLNALIDTYARYERGRAGASEPYVNAKCHECGRRGHRASRCPFYEAANW